MAEQEKPSGSLMARLRSASDARRREEEKASQRQRSDEEFYRECMRPAMLRVYRFLDELLHHLEYLEESVEATYDVPGLGQLEHLVQSKYQLRADTLGDIQQVKLKFECEAPFDFVADLHGPEQVRTALESLERLGLVFSRSREKSHAGLVEEVRVTVRQRFPVILLISVEKAEREIHFRFRNFEGYGDRVKRVHPTDLTDEMLDELAKYILREPSQWAVAKVDEEMRKKLRRELEKPRGEKGWRGFFR